MSIKPVLYVFFIFIRISPLMAAGSALEETYGEFLAYVIRGEYEQVEALLKKGADINQQGPYGKTAFLHVPDLDAALISFLKKGVRLEIIEAQKDRVIIEEKHG